MEKNTEVIGKVENENFRAVGVLTYNDASSPGVEQQNGTNQEGAGQDHTDRQQKPVSETDVLLPEQEGVTVWVVEHTLPTKLVADGPHTLDGLHKVAGLPKAIQVEGELSKLQRFCSWDCNRKRKDCSCRNTFSDSSTGDMFKIKTTYCADFPL